MSKEKSPEIADIINQFRDILEHKNRLSSHQKKVLTNLSQCRTAKLGRNKKTCNCCGAVEISYNSCRDRHCPKCNSTKREKWISSRKEDSLPVNYYHMVFTLPHELNDLCLHNQSVMYKLLMITAWKTILEFSKNYKYMGATPGVIMVLHTWGQNISFHPHVHCIIPACGIDKQGKFRNSKGKGKFLFPVKAMSKVFRGKFTDGLIKLEKDKIIKLDIQFDKDRKYLHPLYRKNWVVYAKKQFPKSNNTIEYLGRYANRIAIANSRIKKVTKTHVTFTWFNYKTSKAEITTMKGEDFLQRFVLHILPVRFQKVRHYGFLSSRNKTSVLKNIRKQIGEKIPESQKHLTWQEIFQIKNNKPHNLCKKCQTGIMQITERVPPQRGSPIIIISKKEAINSFENIR